MTDVPLVLCRERQAIGKNLRQKEKKLKDLSIQMEDDRKQAQQYKDQVSQLQNEFLGPVLLYLNEITCPLLCRQRRATCG